MPHPSSVPRTLTDRQEVFCRHVARGASGAAAARAAGYAPANASHQGNSLLQQPHLRVRIEELRTRRESVRSIAVAEMTDMLRLLMRRAIKAGDHRAAIRCIEVEARLTGLFPDRHSADFVGADPLYDRPDGRPAAMIPDRLFDEMEDEEAGTPTPMNPEETPFFPTVPTPPCHTRARPAYPDGTAMDAASGSPGQSPAMTTGEAMAEQPAQAIEPAHDADEFAPDFDPVEARIRRIAAEQMVREDSIVAECPPQATSPDAPDGARSPWAQVRAVFAHAHGWDNAWADTPWTPPDWLSTVEVRDSRPPHQRNRAQSPEALAISG